MAQASQLSCLATDTLTPTWGEGYRPFRGNAVHARYPPPPRGLRGAAGPITITLKLIAMTTTIISMIIIIMIIIIMIQLMDMIII